MLIWGIVPLYYAKIMINIHTAEVSLACGTMNAWNVIEFIALASYQLWNKASLLLITLVPSQPVYSFSKLPVLPVKGESMICIELVDLEDKVGKFRHK